ncbi:putative avl9 protein [Phaeomoniella chlamydospora]|uniref:Putative avl9 protein n=1 Tax=Phaeomoniella chlamydospora TaxID=158046 RepID=A0A0G2GYS5_PHACM|nr:putative avl9 protein [Phaeomoniella chlamydospora]
MGLPLQLFGKGSFFGPYTPLQQLDLLADYGTKSYIVGSTNSLLLQQKDKYSDILINLDDLSVAISSTSLKSALSLSAADRRWIDFLAQTVVDTWDPSNPSRPNTMGYMGSEEFIRLQFEEYLLALLSCVSYRHHLKINTPSSNPPLRTGEHTPNAGPTDPSLDFGEEFIHAWSETSNYSLFESITNDFDLFDIITPRHPTAGGLGVEDIQRRLAQQVSELHLDERVREGREALNKTLATGQKTFAAGRERVSEGLGRLWADIELMRENQRKKSAERSVIPHDAALSTNVSRPSSSGSSEPAATKPVSTGRFSGFQSGWAARTQNLTSSNVDVSHVQERANAARVQAGAYIFSWSSWANDKKKEWQERKAATSPTTTSSDEKLKENSASTMQQ